MDIDKMNEPYKCFIQLFIVVSIVGYLVVLGFGSSEYVYRTNHNLHGLHKGEVIYTGDYMVSTSQDDYGDIIYKSKCYANTEYGSCYHTCHKSKVYQYSVDYAAEYCIQNTSFIGYISNEIHQCYSSNPNRNVFVYLLMTRIGTAISICIIIAMCISCYCTCVINNDDYISKVCDENENKNENDKPDDKKNKLLQNFDEV